MKCETKEENKHPKKEVTKIKMQSRRSFNKWELIRALGEGGFGEVHLWRHRITRQEIATKILKNISLQPDEIAKLKKRWIQEHNWMHSLQTPYIVGAISLQDKPFLQYLQEQSMLQMLPVIVMEYCNGGDLRSRLEDVQHLNGLPEKEIRDILRALRHAVEYLHNTCNIEHRDIKPENVVIHRTGNANIYKLTDFGYAREIPEQTTAQSMVGTRHYVAPEVIDPGEYTKTVDYWSVGVMAFELILGTRPFIPHREFKTILEQILNKPPGCIAITQDPKPFQQFENFNTHSNLFKQNQCSPIFVEEMEKWLRIALDGNYKTRGHIDGNLRFFTDLDAILATKFITVFSLTSYAFYYFDANSFAKLGEFFNKLSQDTGIEPQNIFITLPTSHPKKCLANISEPSDFYVEEWFDSGNRDNPRAMLYVTDVTKRQCDFNAHHDKMMSQITKTIEECYGIEKQKYDKVPIWLLEQFERHVHYLLQNEQRYLECYVKGLFEFIITVEDEAYRCGEQIQRIYENTLKLSGRVEQFERTAGLCAKIQNSQMYADKAHTLTKKSNSIQHGVVEKIMERHKSVLKHCKALANRDIYKSLPEEDIYKLKSFREFLGKPNLSTRNSQRMDNCMQAFDRWATPSISKFPSQELVNIHDEIMVQCQIFLKITESLKLNQQYLEDLKNELETETENMLLHRQNGELINKMGSLCLDGNMPASSGPSGPMSYNSLTSTYSLMNGHCEENGDNEVLKLIENSHQLSQSLMYVWGNETEEMCVDDNLPTTIKDI
ncbi:inhibitor of nuclear factor kappa B kinase subunit beta [Musca autumnalis]|uniref:inhibitor of nuclear factor kappa B kinase subunit beta n=1 Tax=Musca autumnalis TaxID=221902 RepID=UPI003CEC8F1C